MEDILMGTGIIQYDPKRPGMKHRTDWWCVLNLDTELTRYYRWWLEHERHIQLDEPSWPAHISIIRGENPNNQFLDVWKKHQGQKLNFFYKHGDLQVGRSQRTDSKAELATGGEYYFINVECPKLDEIRTELGLRTGFNYHFTIGRTHEYIARKRGR